MSTKGWIIEALTRKFSPMSVSVVDESHQHAGHAGSRPSGETHFRVNVVAEAFTGKTRIQRHRMVNDALAAAFSERGLHALAIEARAPED